MTDFTQMMLLSIPFVQTLIFSLSLSLLQWLVLLPISPLQLENALPWLMGIHAVVYALFVDWVRTINSSIISGCSLLPVRLPIAVAVVALTEGVFSLIVYVFFAHLFVPFFSIIPLLSLIDFMAILLCLLILENRDKAKSEKQDTEPSSSFEHTGIGSNEDAASIQEGGNPGANMVYENHLAVKDGNRIQVINVKDIIYIEANGDYMMIYTAQKRLIKEETMKNLETQLDPHIFVRVHRSYIVNVHAIERVERYDKQNQALILKNGISIRASLSGYKRLRQTLGI
ncbi:LytR/AlgR family response regulator transcription factor [Porphyromonas macacae]|nr:LytTR family DNA-binding domain-containing protein [Porphyromonas macacae]